MQQFFKLTIEYDGTNYHGWQVQPNALTVQEAIETALFSATNQAVRITGSGRTDAGVHAFGQVASFACQTNLTPNDVQNALNALLPNDIVIKHCENVGPDFHARFSAKSKRYKYSIYNNISTLAIGRQYTHQVRKPLDLTAMQAAANLLVGEHDFACFESVGSLRSSTIRIVYAAVFTRCGDYIFFEIEANGFLRCMVRSIVGTLIDVGLGKYEPAEISHIMASGARCKAGITAPAQGLTLLCVKY